MAKDYSVETCNKLRGRFAEQRLHRPGRIARYEPGEHLCYDMTGVDGKETAAVAVTIERFVGGGFAGQVYQVRVESIITDTGGVEEFGDITLGSVYAMKILIPPAGFSVFFRNLLYYIGFQGPFQLQVNPVAARAGAIWQKFIRRAAKLRFGDEATVNDIHATFVDQALGSCGELSDWVDGRTWRLEVDQNLDALKRWQKGKDVDSALLGSPEYRAKKRFMSEMVNLLHDVGAHEFARQYEWATCKSQPNCLKRDGFDHDPGAGLVAVDFRAGLTLLPVLPMSPGDFKLIYQGIKRGSLVQFDRGDLDRLGAFVGEHAEHFTDMGGLLEELKSCEKIYRDSVPDITHNHLRLLYSPKLWRTMLDSAVTGWRVRGLIDAGFEKKLRQSKLRTTIFFLLGMIPFLGGIIRKCWGHDGWRRHYASILTGVDYFKRAFRGRVAERIITWHGASRLNSVQSLRAAMDMRLFIGHKLLSLITFAGLHRFITDGEFRRDKLHYIFIRPFKLYFNRHSREEWMRDMVRQGQEKHILTDEDAQTIVSQLDEPYIQKYLVSLVVHLMTLPITQIVSVIVAGVYYVKHPEMDPVERDLKVAAILLLFQVIPISPGSFCRGLYTTLLALHDRNFKDYNIALFLSYFKYIGYLAFPIQMSHHYPAMARFMAGHWATDAAHIVPVFGERGALFERWVFCLFYNWPLTIRRRMKKIADLRAALKPRYWHVPLCALSAVAVFVVAERIFFRQIGQMPTLRDIWYITAAVPLLCGGAITLGCEGAVLWKRIVAASVGGVATALIFAAATAIFMAERAELSVTVMAWATVWRAFALTVLATIGAVITELKLPDPDLR